MSRALRRVMKNRSVLTCSFTVVLGLLLTAAFGCSSTVDEVTTALDCHDVCQRYADCFNADYDVDGCTDRCENSADADADRQRKLRTCDNCIDDSSCAASLSCSDECVGIVS
jgi:hypothetical protein